MRWVLDEVREVTDKVVVVNVASAEVAVLQEPSGTDIQIESPGWQTLSANSDLSRKHPVPAGEPHLDSATDNST